MDRPEKILKGVYLVGSENLSGSGDCHIYAIAVNNTEYCLIDAGTGNSDNILENVKTTELGSRKLSYLILTHCHFDHIGAAHQFVKINPQLKIYAHEEDCGAIEGDLEDAAMTAAGWYGSRLIPVKVNHKLEGAETRLLFGDVNLIATHTPGHTPGSIAVVYDHFSGKRILFGQDIHGPFRNEFRSSIRDWADSMKKMLDLDADVLCEGHYGVIRGSDNVKKFIRGYLEQYGF
jgi:glyoxylase-like metal-dependent hydrolase (beta-lactamase superfamily II)